MKTYERMKPSNVLWLGDIPEHWEIRKIKYTFDERVEKGFPDEPLLVASQNMGVVPKSVYGNRTVEALKDLHLLKLVRIGDFVISLRSFQGGIEYAYYQGIISPAYTIMINNGSTIISNYFKYLAKSHRFIELLQMCVTGIREGQNIDYKKLKNESIPIPPREEQDQIVRFLDWKVSGINRLIHIKKKEIEQLNELKKSIVSRAVTRGLNPHAPLKDSNISWLGQIPSHWEAIQLRREFSVTLGKMLAPNASTSDDTYEEYVCSKDVHFDGIELSALKKMWFSPAEKKQYQIKSGDLLVVEGGATGNAALVPDLYNRNIYVQNSIHIVRAKSNNASNKFLYYWLYSLVKQGYMKSICSVATIPHYTKSKVLSTVMPLPPKEEQDEIVRYLDEQTKKIESAIANKQEQIEKLQEFKTRLISDVVTGKLDVRGIEIPGDVFFDGDTQDIHDEEQED